MCMNKLGMLNRGYPDSWFSIWSAGDPCVEGSGYDSEYGDWVSGLRTQVAKGSVRGGGCDFSLWIPCRNLSMNMGYPRNSSTL